MKNIGALACFLLGAVVARLSAGEAEKVLRLNVRDFGAIGDGQEHSVREWIQSGRYSSIRELRRDVPAIGDERWSVDEAAFELAKRALPPEGGTIYFPRGTYLAVARPWTIRRDQVTLVGDGPEATILTTGPGIMDGLVLAGYRHTGWSRGYPFLADDGAVGAGFLRLREPDAPARFKAGQLVFIRNGANKYDQDYGEVNEVSGVLRDGRITLVHPLSRDYTLGGLNWAGKTAEAFSLPTPGDGVRVALARGPGLSAPGRGDLISVGEDIFRVESVAEPSVVRLVNVGRGNAPAGTVVPPGTLVAKERGMVALDETTRDFRCEKLTVRGRRKALTLSNSYDTAFTDCVIERQPGEARITGGIVIDGDDGRFARFVRCEIRAVPACGMQFARSFGGASFEDCRFVNTNAAFTEFNFDCSVMHCTFEVVGSEALQSAVIVGKSCDNLRVIGNVIKGRDLATIFDAQTDIQSFKTRGTRSVVVRGNTIEATAVKRIFAVDRAVAPVVEENIIRGEYEALGRNQTAPPDAPPSGKD